MRRAITLTALPLLLAAPADAYVRSHTESGAAIRWERRCIPYHIHENAGLDDVTFNEALAAVIASFDAWSAPDCSDLSFLYEGKTNDDRIGYRRNAADNTNIVVWRETQEDWAYDRGVIAVTTVTFCNEKAGECTRPGLILDADIELNAGEFDFSVSPLVTRVRFDIANTVTHEVGHLIGLDHSPVPEATMFASAPRGERTKSTLHEDDVQGVCDVYPHSGSDVCEPVAVEGDYYVSEKELRAWRNGESERSAGDDGCAAVGRAPAAPLGGVLLLLGLVRARRTRRLTGGGRAPR